MRYKQNLFRGKKCNLCRKFCRKFSFRLIPLSFFLAVFGVKRLSRTEEHLAVCSEEQVRLASKRLCLHRTSSCGRTPQIPDTAFLCFLRQNLILASLFGRPSTLQWVMFITPAVLISFFLAPLSFFRPIICTCQKISLTLHPQSCDQPPLQKNQHKNYEQDTIKRMPKR